MCFFFSIALFDIQLVHTVYLHNQTNCSICTTKQTRFKMVIGESLYSSYFLFCYYLISIKMVVLSIDIKI